MEAMFTGAQIESIAAKLRDLPPVEASERAYSEAEAIKLLTQDILDLRQRGYTIASIVERLRAEGFRLAAPPIELSFLIPKGVSSFLLPMG